MRWPNVQSINVKFSQDLTHQKSLKSVNFWERYSKNKKVDVFGTQCRSVHWRRSPANSTFIIWHGWTLTLPWINGLPDSVSNWYNPTIPSSSCFSELAGASQPPRNTGNTSSSSFRGRGYLRVMSGPVGRWCRQLSHHNQGCESPTVKRKKYRVCCR